MTSIRFVCATRSSARDFRLTALGRSLELYQYSVASVRLFPENTRGLPEIYNLALRESAGDPAILVFAHDDIHICDFFWPGHLLSALQQYQVVGLAGNRRRVPNQPGWPFVDMNLTNDARENLSGLIAHGASFPPSNFSPYGPVGEAKLLDGLFLAASSEVLLANDIWFDEQFKFHFYDMDFCRQAELKGLKMGTADISVIHESFGGYDSGAWQQACQQYFAKWKS